MELRLCRPLRGKAMPSRKTMKDNRERLRLDQQLRGAASPQNTINANGKAIAFPHIGAAKPRRPIL
jgi:hypothetical protein